MSTSAIMCPRVSVGMCRRGFISGLGRMAGFRANALSFQRHSLRTALRTMDQPWQRLICGSLGSEGAKDPEDASPAAPPVRLISWHSSPRSTDCPTADPGSFSAQGSSKISSYPRHSRCRPLLRGLWSSSSSSTWCPRPGLLSTATSGPSSSSMPRAMASSSSCTALPTGRPVLGIGCRVCEAADSNRPQAHERALRLPLPAQRRDARDHWQHVVPQCQCRHRQLYDRLPVRRDRGVRPDVPGQPAPQASGRLVRRPTVAFRLSSCRVRACRSVALSAAVLTAERTASSDTTTSAPSTSYSSDNTHPAGGEESLIASACAPFRRPGAALNPSLGAALVQREQRQGIPPYRRPLRRRGRSSRSEGPLGPSRRLLGQSGRCGGGSSGSNGSQPSGWDLHLSLRQMWRQHGSSP